ncbi:hypothetical protein C8J57DRAFT_1210691 [Mycena rebaudengoi]|nr:hypothetical protein C8J57DRAFT_1210691 [Mycena rebaudengoi]
MSTVSLVFGVSWGEASLSASKPLAESRPPQFALPIRLARLLAMLRAGCRAGWGLRGGIVVVESRRQRIRVSQSRRLGIDLFSEAYLSIRFTPDGGGDSGRAISGATHNNYVPQHTHLWRRWRVAVGTLWYLPGDPTIIFRALDTLFAEEQPRSEREARCAAASKRNVVDVAL